MLMGLSALAALYYSQGDVTTLVVMYSINVFLTFSLSMIGMCRHWWQLRKRKPALAAAAGAVFGRRGDVRFHSLRDGQREIRRRGLGDSGGHRPFAWPFCFWIHRYYRGVVARLQRLDETLDFVASTSRRQIPELIPACPRPRFSSAATADLASTRLLNAVRFARIISAI